jgi:outer membrane protein OmpA-like peptidoglycan-associated protein
MKNYSLLVILFALAITNGIAQSKKIEKANEYFANFSYNNAIEAYLDLVLGGESSQQVLSNLADAYFFTGNMAEANKWYAQVSSQYSSALNPDVVFRYAKSAQSLGNKSVYETQMDRFAEMMPDDERAKKYLNRSWYDRQITRNNTAYRVASVGFNSEKSDYGAYASPRGIFFVSNRGKKEEDSWSGQPLTDLFVMEGGGTPVPVFKNSKLQLGNAILTQNGTTMYLTQSNMNLSPRELKKLGKVTLKIYRLDWMGDGWSEPVDLPINGEDFNTSHPALSSDGSTLYFASDRSGGFGGMDIYKASVEGNSLGEPVNLGKMVNTEGNEIFPALDSDGVLYFSSDGHYGLGGLDLFAYPVDSDYEAQNLGAPINSGYDDFSIAPKDRTTGYFSSNRPGGQGYDDIYTYTRTRTLTFEEPNESFSDEDDTLEEEESVTASNNQVITGAIQIPDGGGGLSGATVYIYDLNGILVGSALTDANGQFSFPNYGGLNEYNIKVQHPSYEIMGGQQKVSTGNTAVTNLTPTMVVPKSNPVAEETNLKQFLDFNNILFATNSATISGESMIELQKIARFMSENPDVQLDIRSHTDHVGNDEANFRLSTQRATATREKLIGLGVNPNRLTASGYGETEPISCCSNISQNRRSEFIITSGSVNAPGMVSYNTRVNSINYHVIVGGFKNELNAVKEVVRLRASGYNAIKLPKSSSGVYRVSIFNSLSNEEADAKASIYKGDFKGAWVYQTTRSLIQ